MSGIWEDVDWSWGSSTVVDTSYYRIDNEGRFIILKNTTFGDFIHNVKIIYTGGYTTIPLDLKLACTEEVARRYKRRKEIDVTGRTMDDGSTTLLAGDMLPQTKAVLDKYKRKDVV